jgi:hypothetical protein
MPTIEGEQKSMHVPLASNYAGGVAPGGSSSLDAGKEGRRSRQTAQLDGSMLRNPKARPEKDKRGYQHMRPLWHNPDPKRKVDLVPAICPLRLGWNE